MRRRRRQKRAHMVGGAAHQHSVVAAAVILNAVALFMHCGHLARGESLETRHAHLAALVGAIENYELMMKRMPARVQRDKFGRPTCSWRVALLPYLESGSPKYQISLPWYDPANSAIATIAPPCYCFAASRDSPERLCTNVFAVSGDGTGFDDEQVTSLKEMPSDLILLIEIRGSGTHWMEPGDLDVSTVPESITAGLDGAGVLVAFADKEVWFLDRGVPLGDLKKFLTIESSQQFDRQEILGRYRKASYR